MMSIIAGSEKEAPISDHSSNINDPWLILLCILLPILIGLGLHFHHLAGNTEYKNNASDDEVDQILKEGEQEHPSGELDHCFHGAQQLSHRTATRHGFLRRYDACSFCGYLSSTRCSRCKVARYCSETCQQSDWRLGHKFRCVAATVKNENMLMRSDRENWESNARHAVDKLCSFRKENERQLVMLKHENELILNAEKQALQMVHSLSQKLHCLQIEVETGVAERKKQEEYIYMLQKECAKAKTELQEQKKCVQRLWLDEATQFPLRMAEETRQKLADALNVVAAAEINLGHPERKITQPDDQAFQTISLTRNPTYTRQACSICLANEKDMAFGCGHMTCRDCGSKILNCHICRKKISNRIKLFPS